MTKILHSTNGTNSIKPTISLSKNISSQYKQIESLLGKMDTNFNQLISQVKTNLPQKSSGSLKILMFQPQEKYSLVSNIDKADYSILPAMRGGISTNHTPTRIDAAFVMFNIGKKNIINNTIEYNVQQNVSDKDYELSPKLRGDLEACLGLISVRESIKVAISSIERNPQIKNNKVQYKIAQSNTSTLNNYFNELEKVIEEHFQNTVSMKEEYNKKELKLSNLLSNTDRLTINAFNTIIQSLKLEKKIPLTDEEINEIIKSNFSKRQLTRIRKILKELIAKLPEEDPKKLQKFARGYIALKGYEKLLTEEGIKLLNTLEKLLARPTSRGINWPFPTNKLPSVEKPHLEYYKDPITKEVLANFKNSIKEKRDPRFKVTIQIASGCYNKCLHCGVDAESKNIVFMPYPVIKKLAHLFKNAFPYNANDVLHWRDNYFDADYGDLVNEFRNFGGWMITHGFSPGNIYAEDAANKIIPYQKSSELRLGIHLFHKEILPDPKGKPDQKALEKYAKRFAYSINVLKPKTVHLMSHEGGNPTFTSSYLEEFLSIRVKPLLNIDNDVKFEKISTISISGRTIENRDYFPVNKKVIFHAGDFVIEPNGNINKYEYEEIPEGGYIYKRYPFPFKAENMVP